MKFLFKYATRSRPDWFKETIRAWKDNLSGKHEYRFVITCDIDDKTMNNPEMQKFMSDEGLEYHYGEHDCKVSAINDDMDDDFDILVVVSDDMIPVVKGFDDIIVSDFDEGIQALHYNDGGHCGAKLISLTIMDRKLYNSFGYIYHPDYKSMWCDNEFTHIVRERGCVKYIDQVIIKHYWQKYGRDELYNQNDKYWDQDKLTYATRKKEGFKVCIRN